MPGTSADLCQDLRTWTLLALAIAAAVRYLGRDRRDLGVASPPASPPPPPTAEQVLADRRTCLVDVTATLLGSAGE